MKKKFIASIMAYKKPKLGKIFHRAFLVILFLQASFFLYADEPPGSKRKPLSSDPNAKYSTKALPGDPSNSNEYDGPLPPSDRIYNDRQPRDENWIFDPNEPNTYRKQIYIDSIQTSEEIIKAGRRQTIQVNVVNATKTKRRVNVRVRIQNPDGSTMFLDDEDGVIIHRGIVPVLFKFNTEPDIQGFYSLNAYVYVPGRNDLITQTFDFDNFKFYSYLEERPKPSDLYISQNAPNTSGNGGNSIFSDVFANLNPDSQAPFSPGQGGNFDPNSASSLSNNQNNPNNNNQLFALPGEQNNGADGDQFQFEDQGLNQLGNASAGGQQPGQQGSSIAGGSTGGSFSGNTITQTAGLTTNPSAADLEWLEVVSANNAVLRGEVTPIRLILKNKGRDIAENVTYQLFLTTELLKDAFKSSTPIHQGSFTFIAPGESKQLDYSLTFPPGSFTGYYVVTALIDPNNTVLETNKENNVKMSQVIDFSEIALEEPLDSISVRQTGRLTFSWKSNKYTNFYVEIASNESFQENTMILRIPTNEPTPLSSITTLPNEMEILLNKSAEYGVNTVYWRVIGLDTEKNSAESSYRTFFIVR